MYLLREKLLADAALAEDKHRRIGPGDARNKIEFFDDEG